MFFSHQEQQKSKALLSAFWVPSLLATWFGGIALLPFMTDYEVLTAFPSRALQGRFFSILGCLSGAYMVLTVSPGRCCRNNLSHKLLSSFYTDARESSTLNIKYITIFKLF